MYSDVVHALYGQGPYRLHYEYKRFLLTYDQWKSLGRQERILHFKAFMEFEPVRIDEEEQEKGEIASEDYDLSTAQEGDHGIAFLFLLKIRLIHRKVSTHQLLYPLTWLHIPSYHLKALCQMPLLLRKMLLH